LRKSSSLGRWEFAIAVLGFLCSLNVAPAAAYEDNASSPWHYQVYVDAGSVHSNNDPANNLWRSKSSTNEFTGLDLFLAMANLRKEPLPESRWGFEFGLQTGIDSEGLITSPPPPANEPLSNADSLRHLYRANVS